MKILSVVVPVYNEKDNIEIFVDSFLKMEFTGVDKVNLILIDDGSTDGTFEQAGLDASKFVLVSHSTNLGIGSAVKSGLEKAKELNSTYIVKVDADLQHKLEDIIKVLDPILNESSDLVYGDRFKGNLEYKMPITRKVGNVVFSFLMKVLTEYRVSDSQPGLIAMNNKLLNTLHIPGNYNYTQQVLLEASLNGFRFEQVPITFYKRKSGKSFISPIYPFKVIPQLILIFCIMKPMRTFGRIGLISFLIGSFIGIYQLYLFFKGINPKPVMNVNLISMLLLFGIQLFSVGVLGQIIIDKKS